MEDDNKSPSKGPRKYSISSLTSSKRSPPPAPLDLSILSSSFSQGSIFLLTSHIPEGPRPRNLPGMPTSPTIPVTPVTSMTPIVPTTPTRPTAFQRLRFRSGSLSLHSHSSSSSSPTSPRSPRKDRPEISYPLQLTDPAQGQTPIHGSTSLINVHPLTRVQARSPEEDVRSETTPRKKGRSSSLSTLTSSFSLKNLSSASKSSSTIQTSTGISRRKISGPIMPVKVDPTGESLELQVAEPSDLGAEVVFKPTFVRSTSVPHGFPTLNYGWNSSSSRNVDDENRKPITISKPKMELGNTNERVENSRESFENLNKRRTRSDTVRSIETVAADIAILPPSPLTPRELERRMSVSRELELARSSQSSSKSQEFVAIDTDVFPSTSGSTYTTVTPSTSSGSVRFSNKDVEVDKEGRKLRTWSMGGVRKTVRSPSLSLAKLTSIKVVEGGRDLIVERRLNWKGKGRASNPPPSPPPPIPLPPISIPPLTSSPPKNALGLKFDFPEKSNKQILTKTRSMVFPSAIASVGMNRLGTLNETGESSSGSSGSSGSSWSGASADESTTDSKSLSILDSNHPLVQTPRSEISKMGVFGASGSGNESGSGGASEFASGSGTRWEVGVNDMLGSLGSEGGWNSNSGSEEKEILRNSVAVPVPKGWQVEQLHSNENLARRLRHRQNTLTSSSMFEYDRDFTEARPEAGRQEEDGEGEGGEEIESALDLYFGMEEEERRRFPSSSSTSSIVTMTSNQKLTSSYTRGEDPTHARLSDLERACESFFRETDFSIEDRSPTRESHQVVESFDVRADYVHTVNEPPSAFSTPSITQGGWDNAIDQTPPRTPTEGEEVLSVCETPRSGSSEEEEDEILPTPFVTPRVNIESTEQSVPPRYTLTPTQRSIMKLENVNIETLERQPEVDEPAIVPSPPAPSSTPRPLSMNRPRAHTASNVLDEGPHRPRPRMIPLPFLEAPKQIAGKWIRDRNRNRSESVGETSQAGAAMSSVLWEPDYQRNHGVGRREMFETRTRQGTLGSLGSLGSGASGTLAEALENRGSVTKDILDTWDRALEEDSREYFNRSFGHSMRPIGSNIREARTLTFEMKELMMSLVAMVEATQSQIVVNDTTVIELKSEIETLKREKEQEKEEFERRIDEMEKFLRRYGYGEPESHHPYMS